MMTVHEPEKTVDNIPPIHPANVGLYLPTQKLYIRRGYNNKDCDVQEAQRMVRICLPTMSRPPTSATCESTQRLPKTTG